MFFWCIFYFLYFFLLIFKNSWWDVPYYRLYPIFVSICLFCYIITWFTTCLVSLFFNYFAHRESLPLLYFLVPCRWPCSCWWCCTTTSPPTPGSSTAPAPRQAIRVYQDVLLSYEPLLSSFQEYVNFFLYVTMLLTSCNEFKLQSEKNRNLIF